MSCPFSVQLVRQTTNSIQLSWTPIDQCDVYKVVKLKESKPTVFCNRTARAYWYSNVVIDELWYKII